MALRKASRTRYDTAMNNQQRLRAFLQSETTGGALLIGAALIGLLLANGPLSSAFQSIATTKIGIEALDLNMSIQKWTADALLAIFFFVIGCELKHELVVGTLLKPRQAVLPVAAALGGMAVPALLYVAISRGGAADAVNGWGIPMATDIAFALGILSLAGKSVPTSLKIFLTALAIIDDLGAILVIAIFYTHELSLLDLSLALGIFIALFILGKLGMRRLIFFLIPGAFMWYFMHESGVHATISGVLLAFAIPFGGTGKESPSYRLQHALHNPVAFGIVPLFALANTGIVLQPAFYNSLLSLNSLGIVGGLFLGKPIFDLEN